MEPEVDSLPVERYFSESCEEVVFFLSGKQLRNTRTGYYHLEYNGCNRVHINVQKYTIITY